MKYWSTIFYSISFVALVIVAAVRISSFEKLRDFAARTDHTRELVTTLQNVSIALKSAQIYSPKYEKLDTLYYNLYKTEGLKTTEYLRRLDSLARNDDSLARFTDSISSYVQAQLPALLEKNIVEIINQHETYRLNALFIIESAIQRVIRQRNQELSRLRKDIDAQMYDMKMISLSLVIIALAALLFGIRTNFSSQRRQRNLIAQLREQQGQLAATNQRLEKYVYAASHDFQEPLRKIMMFSDLLKNEIISDSGQQKVSRVIAAAQRMSQLIKDTLQLSALHKNQPFVSVDLNKIVADVIEDLELLIKERDANIECDPLPTITGSEVQLRQLFVNLLSNALKFSYTGRKPEIKITNQNFLPEKIPSWNSNPNYQYFHIAIQDNGIGIPKGSADSIFDMFVKLHPTTQYSGTGIGLALCRQVVANHGGYIWAEKAMPFGTVFHVVLPSKQ